jgi:phosphoglycolate phosphatase
VEKRVAIFDLDGTLVDSTHQIFNAMTVARNYMDLPEVTIHFIAQNLGLPIMGLIPEKGLPENDYVKLISLFRKELLRLINKENIVFVGALAFLDELLSRGWNIAVATSKPQNLAEAVIMNSELKKRVAFIQGTDGFLPKPNPEVIHRCLSNFGSTDAIMFGDRMEDMAAAKSAGIKSVGVMHSTHNEDQLLSMGADFIIKDWNEGMKNLSTIIDI